MGKGKKRKAPVNDDVDTSGTKVRKGKTQRIRKDDSNMAAGAVASTLDPNKAMKEDDEFQERLAEAAAAQAAAEAAGEAPEPEAENIDPYLMADAEYIQKDTRWKNKQRTLVFCSRGVTSQFRHLAEDVKKLLPHMKSEPKFEKKSALHEINEVAELKSCNNVLFFEARKMTDLYMYVARVPSGPTLKFQVLNIHTTSEVRLAGNCLVGSRPLLYFDKNFDNISFLKLTKTMFIQALGTPRNHPKSKPFHDHIMCFYYLDRKIWFRHYQISPETQSDENDPEKQQLTEIGPRFVLDPVCMLGGSFGGPKLFENAFYMSPTALRVQAKKFLAGPYRKRKEAQAKRAQHLEDIQGSEDELEEVFK